MAGVLTEAWKHFRSHPECYVDWKRIHIGDCDKSLAVRFDFPIRNPGESGTSLENPPPQTVILKYN